MAGAGLRTATKWVALRALAEGGEPSKERLAAASGLSVRGIAARAAAEGWDARRPGPAADLDARIARLMDNLVRETAELEAPGDGRDKARIEGLTARMRLLEKLAEINEGRQARQEEQQKTDAEIAEILRRIDARIVELAHEFAAELAGDRDARAAGAAGGG